MLDSGAKAPEFTLLDQKNQEHSLQNHQGKWVLVYFYPKDDTPGCTKEACGFRDSFAALKNRVTILGVSADSVKKHQKFADKFKLPFTLLSDPDKIMIEAYEAWGKKKFMGREYDGIFRISYLINPEGIIAKTYPDVKPDQHAAEIIRDLNTLSI
jgi:thioredoxin-dependent peroxiredoxin